MSELVICEGTRVRLDLASRSVVNSEYLCPSVGRYNYI